MPWTNYHSHTNFSDGSHLPEFYAAAAAQAGMPAYGFSCHAPVAFPHDWTIRPDQLRNYLAEIDRIKLEFRGQIEILKSLEIDFLPGSPMCWASTRKPWELDYIIGSVHFVDTFADGTPWNIDTSQSLFDRGLNEIFGGDIRRAAERFFELSCIMVGDMRPDIIGHLDKIKMFCMAGIDQSQPWYRQQIGQLLSVMKQHGTIMEINTRGYYKGKIDEMYPSQWVMREAFLRGIPVTICSDCHHPSELTLGYEAAAQQLAAAGYRTVSVLENGAWVQKDFAPQTGIAI